MTALSSPSVNVIREIERERKGQGKRASEF